MPPIIFVHFMSDLVLEAFMDYEFSVEKTVDELTCWLKNWFTANGNSETKAVVGISGGKDSSTVAALLVHPLGVERVIGVLMPNGEQKDISDSKALVSHLGIKNFMVNIADAVTGLKNAFVKGGIIADGNEFAPAFNTNTPARIRMSVLYGVAAQLGNCRVANTCNLSEDLQGYSTFYGDSAGDFAPIRMLTTEEVIAVGKFLGLPDFLMDKAPSDGMCGKTDEDNLGYTYHEVNELARLNKKGANAEKIINRYKANLFKIKIIDLPCYKPDLPLFLEI